MNKALSRNLAYSQCSINGGFLPLPKSTARITVLQVEPGQTGISGGSRAVLREPPGGFRVKSKVVWTRTTRG